MAYQKQTWNNDPSGETPITAERLNHIEDGISNAVETDSVARVSNVVSRNKAGLKEIAWIQSMDYINTTSNGVKYKAKAEQYTGFNLILSKSLEIGKEYTLSFKNNSSDNIAFSVVKSSNGWQNDYDNAYVKSEFINSNSSYSYTFTALTNIIGIMFICSTNSNADTNERDVTNIQVEEGSTAKSYVPYLNLEEVQEKLNDTGWVDMRDYINTTYFYAREGFAPKARKINGVIYWAGMVYCHTNVDNVYANILQDLPDWVLPVHECNKGGVQWVTAIPYAMFIDHTGNVTVRQAQDITAQSDQSIGYTLTVMSGYLIG